MSKPPKAFICHSSEDDGLSKQIASDLRANGVEAWLDEWEICDGDSLTRKINDGIEECDIFIAVITPGSLKRAWVQHELSAGMIKRIEGSCKLIPVLKDVTINELPITFKDIKCRSISNYTNDVNGLIKSCHGISDKPPLGQPPKNNSIPHITLTQLGSSIARYLSDKSISGMEDEQPVELAEIMEKFHCSKQDAEDACVELKSLALVTIHVSTNYPYKISSKDTLFWQLDEAVKGWKTKDDAQDLATLLVNQEQDIVSLKQLQEQLGWDIRRINPAATFLVKHGICDASDVHSNFDLAYDSIWATAHTRNWLKGIAERE